MSLENLKSVDTRILEILQRDGRITNADLAERISLSPSPCLRRVKRLEEQGIIQGYGARLDGEKLGWNLTAFVSISLRDHGQAGVDAFQAEIAKLSQVRWCWALSGATDLLLKVVAADLRDFYGLMVVLGGLPGISQIQSSIGINELKNAPGLPLARDTARA